MSLRRLVAMLAVLGSLLVLCALVWKSQQRPLDEALVTRQLVEIGHAARSLEAVQQALADARMQRDGLLLELDARQDSWRAADQRLQAPALGLAADPAAAGSLRRYLDAAQTARRQIEGLHEPQQAFVAAFDALGRQAERAIAELVGSGASDALRLQVVSLMDEMARYALQARPDNGARLDGLILALDAELPELADAAHRVRAAKDRLQPVYDGIVGALPSAALADLAEQRQAGLMLQDLNARRYTVALAAFAGALLLVFGLIGLRLQGSLGALDAINANLEQQVEQRTAELRMQQAHLIQSEKLASLGQMVAGVAHEINTPLGYAFSNVETVKISLGEYSAQAKLDDDGQERMVEADVLLEDAMHGLGQIDELVKSLKNFSRMDRSHTELFDLNEGLDTALKICHNQLKDRITVERDYAELPRIACAPSQLNQVFLNLLNNGAQAIEGEGSIRISSRLDGDMIEIIIQDSGCGMDEETAAHIFEPFFTTKPVGEGTGLGLSIVFRIIEDHRGTVRVQSAPGEGAAFIIRLPVSEPQQRFGVADFDASALTAEPA